MSSDKRMWRCPECSSQVELSNFQLDPLACDACMAKRKSGGSSGKSTSGDAGAATGAMSQIGGLPEVVKLAAALIVGLIVGGPIGFIAGRVTALQSSQPTANAARSTSSRGDESTHGGSHDDEPEESTSPGPGHKWVKGYTRKDGTQVKGHWAKDSSKKH